MRREGIKRLLTASDPMVLGQLLCNDYQRYQLMNKGHGS